MRLLDIVVEYFHFRHMFKFFKSSEGYYEDFEIDRILCKNNACHFNVERKSKHKVKGKMTVTRDAIKFSPFEENILEYHKWSYDNLTCTRKVGNCVAFVEQDKDAGTYQCHSFFVRTVTSERIEVLVDYAQKKRLRDFNKKIVNTYPILKELTSKFESSESTNVETRGTSIKSLARPKGSKNNGPSSKEI